MKRRYFQTFLLVFLCVTCLSKTPVAAKSASPQWNISLVVSSDSRRAYIPFVNRVDYPSTAEAAALLDVVHTYEVLAHVCVDDWKPNGFTYQRMYGIWIIKMRPDPQGECQR